MLRRILLLIDDTDSSQCARQYAVQLAKTSEAELTGLAGVDLTFIEAPKIGRAGAASYKAKMADTLKAQTRDINLRFANILETECKSNGISFELQSFEGDPISTICAAAARCDLLITGHDTAFRGIISEQLSDMISKFVQLSPRPTIVCPDKSSDAEEIMIAYDDSPTAMRAVQMFVLLGVGLNKLKYVTTISRSRQEAVRQAAKVANYLLAHGHKVRENPIETRKGAAKVLNDEVSRLGIGTLVMGAYAHNRVRRFLFGSTTSALIKAPPCKLFLVH